MCSVCDPKRVPCILLYQRSRSSTCWQHVDVTLLLPRGHRSTHRVRLSLSDGQGQQVFSGAGHPEVCTAAGHSGLLLSVMCTASGHRTQQNPPLCHREMGKETAPGSSELSTWPSLQYIDSRKPYINTHEHHIHNTNLYIRIIHTTYHVHTLINTQTEKKENHSSIQAHKHYTNKDIHTTYNMHIVNLHQEITQAHKALACMHVHVYKANTCIPVYMNRPSHYTHTHI